MVSTTATAQTTSPLSASHVALFDEVWRTVNDNFYDTAFGGVNWAAVRDELRPKAAAASTMDDARAVVREMLARLRKSHLALLSGTEMVEDDMVLRGEAVVPIDVRVLANQIVITRVRPSLRVSAERARTLKPGAALLSVDGRDVRPRAGESPLISWRRANAVLHGLDDSTAVLRVSVPALPGADTPAPVVVQAAREIPQGTRMQFSNLPPMRVQVDSADATTPAGRRVGVIGFNIWMAQVDGPFAAAIDTYRGASGLVIDLRGNPGGLAAMINNMAGHLIDDTTLLGTMHTRSVPELTFKVNPRRSTVDGRSVAPFAGPVAILVDDLTASASECFAGALQDLGRARVFGRRSMGMALPASTKRLSNGDVLEYVVGDFVTSKGRSLEGTGVVPDEVQTLSIASLAAGRDEPLLAALAWIDRQSK